MTTDNLFGQNYIKFLLEKSYWSQMMDLWYLISKRWSKNSTFLIFETIDTSVLLLKNLLIRQIYELRFGRNKFIIMLETSWKLMPKGIEIFLV